MLSRLRIIAFLGARLLPVVGPLLIERDLLRSALAAAVFEADTARLSAKLRAQAEPDLCEQQEPLWL